MWQHRAILSICKTWLGRSGVAVVMVALAAACSSKKKGLSPLTAQSWKTELAVPGFGPATVALPLGAITARPIAVVLHGEGDRADWQCGSFRGLLGGNVFIVCPQGRPGPAAGRFGWGSSDETSIELRAALAALKTRFGEHVAPSPILLIGYGRGGELAAALARQEPSFFARVALIDSDAHAFSSSATAIFGQRGGKRVLFFCTSASCDDHAVSRALLLSRANVSAKAVRKEVGPYLDADYTAALAPELAWLLEGDARFRQRPTVPAKALAKSSAGK